MDSIYSSFFTYTKKPLNFVYPVLTFSIMLFFFSLLILSLDIILVGILKNMELTIYVFGISFILICLIVLSFKGGFYRGIYIATTNKRQSLSNFFKSSYTLFLPFLLINILKFLIFFIFLIPLIAIYMYYYSIFDSLFVKIAVGLIYTFIYWILTYFFRVSELVYSAKKVDIRKALSLLHYSLKLSVKRFFSFFPLYFIESIVFITLFVPIINLFSIFVFYPVILGSWFYEIEKKAVSIKRR